MSFTDDISDHSSGGRSADTSFSSRLNTTGTKVATLDISTSTTGATACCGLRRARGVRSEQMASDPATNSITRRQQKRPGRSNPCVGSERPAVLHPVGKWRYRAAKYCSRRRCSTRRPDPPAPQHRRERDVAHRANETCDSHDRTDDRTPNDRQRRVVGQEERTPET